MSNKSIKKNYIYNVAYQILAIILPIITTPYLSRVLGAENIGIYGYTLSITTYFILFGSLGVAMYGQREIAYVQNDINKRSKVFFEIFIMKCVTLFISVFIFFIVFCLKGEYKTYYKIFLLEIFANMVDISWMFQGMEEFKKTVTRNFIIKIASLIMVFVFVKNHNDLYKYILIYVGSTFFGNISLWMYLPKFIKRQNITDLNVFQHIKPTLLLFVPQIAVQVYTLLDKTMLGVLGKDMNEVGYYEQSQKIIKASLVLVTSLGTVVAPRIANTIATGNKSDVNSYLEKSYRFVWFLGFPIMLGLIATSKNMVPWFLGEEFIPAIPIIMIGAGLIMAIGLNNVSGMQYLIPAKRQNLFTKSVVIAALFNFTLNFLFIPKIGATGAIISSVMAETLIIIIQVIDIRKEVNIKIIYKDAFRYIIGSFIMSVPVFIIGLYMKANMITTAIQVVIGAAVYILYLLIIKDALLFDNMKKILKKLRRKTDASEKYD